MKKLVVYVLTVSMVLGLAACGGKKDQNGTSQNQTQTENPGTNNEQAGSSQQDGSVAEDTDIQSGNTEGDNSQGSAGVEDSIGSIIKADFREICQADDSLSAEEIAAKLCENPALVVGPVAMPIEAGLLNGLGNTEINGFKEGALFAPMIGSIPFIGYVFVLDEGADINSFMMTLQDSADPRWNICTQADEVIIDNVDNTVLFVMCPTSFEEE